METRNDGSHGKTAAQIIGEDATRNSNSNPHAYRTALSYDNDSGELDAEDVEDIDDDFLDNDDSYDNFEEDQDDVH